MEERKTAKGRKQDHRSDAQWIPVSQTESDPYGAGLVDRKLRILKAPVSARPVGILTNFAQNRDLGLIAPPSRAVRENDVHELSCTTEKRQPGDIVQNVGYLAFVTFEQSGVLAAGDILEVDGRDFGVVLGFNEVHSPNHINVVVLVESLTTGFEAGWRLDTSLRFKRTGEEGLTHMASKNCYRKGGKLVNSNRNDGASFRFQRYQTLSKARDEILAVFREIAESLDTEGIRASKIGMLGGSGGPPVLGESVRAAIDEGSKKLVPLSSLDDRIRVLVKEVYGDEWDGVAVASAEGALWVTFEALTTPPMLVRGDKYQASFITPLERHSHHQAAYGAPFPPWLKDHIADRGVTAGELGMQAKRRENLRAIFVPLVGASYECHGIKYHPAFLLLNTDGSASAAKIRQVVARHVDGLSAIVSMGYDTPGYGYREKNANGVPVLQSALGELAAELDIPYIVDNARGTPFLGLDPREVGASVVIYSTDKAFGGPTGGLIIGKEEYMVPIRRAVGVHGNRWGTTTSHGKAGYVMVDPGKEALLGIVSTLETIQESPEILTKPIKSLFNLTETIASEELGETADSLSITHSVNSLAVEINYEGTWESDSPIPIFPIEDYYSGANLIQYGLAGAGVSPPLCYDANIVVGPLSNMCDEEGVLNTTRAEFALRTMFRGIRYLTERFNRAK